METNSVDIDWGKRAEKRVKVAAQGSFVGAWLVFTAVLIFYGKFPFLPLLADVDRFVVALLSTILWMLGGMWAGRLLLVNWHRTIKKIVPFLIGLGGLVSVGIYLIYIFIVRAIPRLLKWLASLVARLGRFFGEET